MCLGFSDHATGFSIYDLCEHGTPDDQNIPPDLSSTSPHNYSPYPNFNLYLIGKWYWDGGEKKLQASLQDLIKIVGHPEFRSEDAAGQNW